MISFQSNFQHIISILQSANEAIIEFESDGIIHSVWINNNFKIEPLASSQNFIGRNISEVTTNPISSYIKVLIENVILTRTPNSFEMPSLVTSGRWFLVQCFPTEKNPDKNSRVVFIFTDISKYKLKEAEAETNKRKFETIFNSANESFIIMDHVQFLDCNKTLLDLFEIPSKEHFLKLKIGSLSPDVQPDGQNSRELILKKIIKTQKFGSNRFQWIFKKQTGETFLGDVTFKTLELDNQNVVIIWIKDLTKEKIQERQIEKLQMTLDAMKIGTFTYDFKNGKLEFDNLAFEILGFMNGVESDSYSLWKKLIPIEDLDEMESFVLKISQLNDTNFKKTVRINHYETQEELFISITGRIERDLKYNPIKLTALFWDITKEHILSQQNDENKIKIQTASKMALLGEMAAGIAHEINNPLSIIQGYVKLMLKNIESNRIEIQEFQKAANKIDSTTERIAKIVRSFRGFARNENSDPFIEVSVSQIIEESIELCQTKLRNSGVKLVTPKRFFMSLVLECHPIQISQVLLNLISNSIDAIENLQDKWIQIDIQNLEDSIEFSITDSGNGIPQEIADRLSMPFFTTKEPGKGTGLGLSITRNIVEKHLGKLTLDKSSKNTRFVFILPKKQAPIKQEETKSKLAA